MRRWSLAARLTAYFAATVFLLVAAAYIQYRTLVTSLAEEDDQLLLEGLASGRAAGVAITPGAARQGTRGPLTRALSRQCEPSGESIGAAPPPRCDAGTGEAPILHTWRSPDGHTWRVATGRTATGWIEVLLDRSRDDDVLDNYRRQLVAVLGATLLVASGLGLAIAHRWLRPLGRLARRVAVIDARSLGQRVARGDEPTEIRALVASFDGMLDRLDRAFRALTEFSGDLAHELRTPIHVLRQQAEVALQRARSPEDYREVLGSSLEELDRMRRMVDDTLFLARAEDPRSVIQRAPLSLAAEIADVADFLQADAAEREVALSCDAPAALVLAADRTLVRRALVNVVTNALRHTPAGGCVELSARDDGRAVVVEVRDTGIGVPAELLSHVFDRHVRGRDAAAGNPGGAGLGLAIVRGIMTLHGGSAAMSSVPGEGARVTLTFPRPASDSTDSTTHA